MWHWEKAAEAQQRATELKDLGDEHVQQEKNQELHCVDAEVLVKLCHAQWHNNSPICTKRVTRTGLAS